MTLTAITNELDALQPTFTSEKLTPKQYLRRVKALVTEAQLHHNQNEIGQLIEAGARHIRALNEFLAVKSTAELSILWYEIYGAAIDMDQIKTRYKEAVKKLIVAIRPTRPKA